MYPRTYIFNKKIVPHLPIIPWKGRVEEKLRPASVTPAAGVVGAGGQKLDITKIKRIYYSV